MKSEFNYIVRTLKSIYSETESFHLAQIIFTDILNISKTEIFINPDLPLNKSQLKKIDMAVKRLLNNEPIQYIAGFCHFHDLKFFVNNNVLIPRSETEELVSLILRETKTDSPSVLDIGTGSGCIAVSIQKSLPFSKVIAFDINKKIIALAKKNAKINSTHVKFKIKNLFTITPKDFKTEYFDIIVSNPPYVKRSEKKYIHKRVLDYEPSSALFVPDNDPLLYFRTIIEKTLIFLKNEGKFYFEINENSGAEIVSLLEKFNLQDICLYQDIHDKNRFVSAKKG